MNSSSFPASTKGTMSMSHFLFPPSLFAHSFCQIGNEHGHGLEDPARDKMGKSFTIDSLLGLSNAAARAVLQSGISHHHQSAINLANSIRSDCWRFENDYDYSEIEQGTNSESGNLRFLPYNVQQQSQSQTQTLSQTNSSASSAIPALTMRQGKVSNSNSGNKKNTTVFSADSKSHDNATQIIRRVTKTKRVRTIFTPEQLERLETEFERQQYMVGPERLYLASSLNLTEAQVKVWFQNRRIKWRKQHFEMQQQRLAVLRSQQTDLEEEEDSSSDFGSSESMSSNPNAVSPAIFETEISSVNSPNRQSRQQRK